MSETNRRDFLSASAIGAAALLAPSGVHAAADNMIKVGVIGCGGRGRGAAINTLDGNPDVKITAIGDVFDDSIKSFIANVGKAKSTKDRLAVTPETTFVGLDAYQKVIDSGVDLVILASPPGFRPIHLEAAVKKGVHIFTEKPVAVDAAGIRKVLALVEESKKKNISIVAGTQRRHQKGYLDTIAKLQNDKAIGDIVAGRVYWNNTNSIWFRPRKEGMSDVQYQIHNWYHFNWLCGDHIVEQHVHNLDVANWVLGSHPLRCNGGMGGRVRPCKDPNVDGQIFDHFALEYEYPNGFILQSFCRQIDSCSPGVVEEHFVGSKGRCRMKDGLWFINDEEIKGGPIGPYVQEHIDLVNSIKSKKHLNELQQVAESTLTAIMGRMCAYTGKSMTWEQALKSQENTMPANLDWNGKLEVSAVPVPGKTKLI
ncbi:MAG: Gfo/Idh/MocA family oxidoreductase [Planctomycetes bacterium]|nr:Gfo/Idh/MocA family oxidoreductase [Planctomycetota bacterium]